MTDMQYLVETARLAVAPLDEICMHVLNNPDFTQCPASEKHHHNYEGGLLGHTTDLLCRLRPYFTLEHIDQDVLITAAIWHDYHKIYEYNWHHDDVLERFVISKLPYTRLIGHIVGGYSEFVRVAAAHELNTTTTAKIGHCILSHHGRQEWGSPVEPQTDEAFLLHTMDMRSVQDYRP